MQTLAGIHPAPVDTFLSSYLFIILQLQSMANKRSGNMVLKCIACRVCPSSAPLRPRALLGEVPPRADIGGDSSCTSRHFLEFIHVHNTATAKHGKQAVQQYGAQVHCLQSMSVLCTPPATCAPRRGSPSRRHWRGFILHQSPVDTFLSSYTFIILQLQSMVNKRSGNMVLKCIACRACPSSAPLRPRALLGEVPPRADIGGDSSCILHAHGLRLVQIAAHHMLATKHMAVSEIQGHTYITFHQRLKLISGRDFGQPHKNQRQTWKPPSACRPSNHQIVGGIQPTLFRRKAPANPSRPSPSDVRSLGRSLHEHSLAAGPPKAREREGYMSEMIQGGGVLFGKTLVDEII